MCVAADVQESDRRAAALAVAIDAQSLSSTEGGGGGGSGSSTSLLSPRLALSMAPSVALRRMLCTLLYTWLDSIQSISCDPLAIASGTLARHRIESEQTRVLQLNAKSQFCRLVWK